MRSILRLAIIGQAGTDISAAIAELIAREGHQLLAKVTDGLSISGLDAAILIGGDARSLGISLTMLEAGGTVLFQKDSSGAAEILPGIIQELDSRYKDQLKCWQTMDELAQLIRGTRSLRYEQAIRLYEEAALFHDKFELALPYVGDLQERFLDIVRHRSPIRTALEIGCGRGELAKTILSMHPEIERYVALEPSPGMSNKLHQGLATDERFQLIPATFQDWQSAEGFDLVVSQYVSHDTGIRIEDWYVKIAECLNPGGIFIHQDVGITESMQKTLEYVDEMVVETLAIPVDSVAEDRARRSFANHLQAEPADYHTMEGHCEVFRSVGLTPEVIATSKHNYLLIAKK